MYVNFFPLGGTTVYGRRPYKVTLVPSHSGGNDRFCARLKTDISASNSGLRGRTLHLWKEVAATNLK
jgi:hypothetical protein